MHVRHLEEFFSIDKVVPVDLFPAFLADTITVLFIHVCFYGSHTFLCRSLLLSTTVLNDNQNTDIHKFTSYASTIVILKYQVAKYTHR